MISLENINRSFGDRHVLKNVSFDIADGRMTGFVGGNGAGKTTTMRILLGVLSSDSGTITMNGEKITRVDRAEIGYMPEERGLYPKMKVRDQLQYLGELHGLTADDARTNTTDLLDRLEVGERAGDKLEDLSLGNQQRVQIAAALVHRTKSSRARRTILWTRPDGGRNRACRAARCGASGSPGALLVTPTRYCRRPV